MNKSAILLLCLLLVTPLPLAGATSADLWVSYGNIDRLNPEFTLGGEVRVRFSYWATCSGECEASEWRLIVDHWSSGAIPDAELPAGVASGSIAFPAGESYQANLVVASFSAAGLAPGHHSLKVATRAAGADVWSVSWGPSVQILDPADYDSDLIPDSLEGVLCGDEVASLAMLAVRDGCHGWYGWYDIDLEGGALVLGLPRLVWLDDSHDWDDMDGYVRAIGLQMTRVNLMPGIALADMIEPGDEHRVVLDPVDDRRARALHLCARIPAITAFAWSADADGDGWPERGSFALGEVCDDARLEREPRLVPATDVFGARIDYDDGDAEITQEAPFEAFYEGVHAAFGPDMDADGVPTRSEVTYASVTFDPARPVPMEASYETYAVDLDLDDEDRDLPVLFSPLDAEGDGVPELAEPYLCAWDDPFTPEDGTCTVEGRFTPPQAFTSRFEAPLLLEDDDLDLLPDGAEAAACDAGARVASGWMPCAGYDAQVLPW